MQRQLLQQCAAAAVAILLDDKDGFRPPNGKRKDAANSYVVRRLRRLGLKAVDDTKIANWRDSVSKYLCGFGSPGKPDKIRPEPTQCDYHVRFYANAWLAWRRLAAKGEPATRFVDELLNENLKPLF